MSELGDLFKHPDKRLWLISLWEHNEYYKLLPNKIGVDKDWNFLVKFTKHNRRKIFMSFHGIIENYDSAATTPTDERVIREMIPYFYDRAANSSSLSFQGRKNREIIDSAQARIAMPIGCGQEEVYLTSGGTESNNWAIRGVPLYGKSIAVCSTEHLSVLKTARLVAPTIEIGVNSTGVIDLNELYDVIQTGQIGLVSVHWANNETGTIQTISEIHEMCQDFGVTFHTDASQAYGKIPIFFDADLMTISAHKIYGPKGVGALIIRNGLEISPILTGGSHQHGLRAGSLPVPLIVGFGKACSLIEENFKFQGKIKNHIDSILNVFSNYDNVIINSDNARIPSFLNFSLEVDSAEVIAIMEEKHGVYLSKGAACMEGKPSYVLQAQGRSYKHSKNSIRLSFNKFNKLEKIGVFPHNIQACIRAVSEGEK
jgi:cysteine desulfurase